MKKITSILLALALMASLLVAVPAMTAEALTDATTPYTDTFDGSKGGNYTAHGIFWNGVNGKLNVGYNSAQPSINGGGWHYYYLKDLNWKNFTMEFDVENQTSQFGVVIRAGNPGPGADQGDGYTIMNDKNYAIVGKLTGSFSQVKTNTEGNGYAFPTSGHPNTHWKIVAKDDVITLTMTDGGWSQTLQVQDDTFASGVIGFRALNVESQVCALVDNLTITPIEDAPPPSSSSEEPSSSSQTPSSQDPSSSSQNPSSQAPSSTAPSSSGAPSSQNPSSSQQPSSAGPSSAAPSSNKPAQVSLNFSDSFDGSKAEEWTPYGIWYNQDGVLTANGGPTDGEAWTYYYLNNRRYQDFTMEFDVLSQKANQFGVVLRTSAQTAEPDLKDGYAIMNDKAWAFFGKFNGKWNTINTETGNGVPGSDILTEYEIAGNIPKHWKVVAKDGVISVYFDGAQTPSMQVQDNAYTSGLIGFRCLTQPNEEASVKIANFSITGDGSTTTDAGYIKTGDQTSYTLWIALAAIALLGGAAVFTVRRKGCKAR